MVRLNLSIPAEMSEFIRRQMAEHSYMTQGEFVRDLVRRERDEQEVRRLLEENGGMVSRGKPQS